MKPDSQTADKLFEIVDEVAVDPAFIKGDTSLATLNAVRKAYNQGIEDVLAYLDKEGISHNGFASLFDEKNARWIREALKVQI